MAITAKNLSFEKYAAFVEQWNRIESLLIPIAFDGTPREKTLDAVFIPVGSHKSAWRTHLTFNLVRAALRVQQKDNRFDSITVRLVRLEGDKEWGLKFTDGAEENSRMVKEFKLLDENGNAV